MIQTTIGGIEVFIGKFWDIYVIISDNDFHLTKEKPTTDQELEKIYQDLEKIQQDIEQAQEDLNRFF